MRKSILALALILGLTPLAPTLAHAQLQPPGPVIVLTGVAATYAGGVAFAVDQSDGYRTQRVTLDGSGNFTLTVAKNHPQIVTVTAPSGVSLLPIVAAVPFQSGNFTITSLLAAATPPPARGSAASGTATVAVGSATVVVSHTTANTTSSILLTYSGSCGALPTNLATLGPPVATPALGSFTITLAANVATNAACIAYQIVN